jgi:hypothetical protein
VTRRAEAQQYADSEGRIAETHFYDCQRACVIEAGFTAGGFISGFRRAPQFYPNVTVFAVKSTLSGGMCRRRLIPNTPDTDPSPPLPMISTSKT